MSLQLTACLIGRNDDEAKEPELLWIDISGSIIRKIPLPKNIHFPIANWSPDGEKLAIGYTDEDQASTDILTLDTEITETMTPEWPSDGRWLLVSRIGANASSVILMVNGSSREALELTRGVGGIWQS